MHIENKLLIHSIKSVEEIMKTNIREVDCFTLFEAHQPDIITNKHT